MFQRWRRQVTVQARKASERARSVWRRTAASPYTAAVTTVFLEHAVIQPASWEDTVSTAAVRLLVVYVFRH
jgi:hypothetical protein